MSDINLNDPHFLMIPLHILHSYRDYHRDGGETMAVFTAKLIAEKNQKCSEEIKLQALNNIHKELKWAVGNPDYDFLSRFPEIPGSNYDIYSYLVHLEREVKDLLFPLTPS